MPIDTSIYGNIKQYQAPDPMEAQQNAMKLSQLSMQNQSIASDMQQKEQQRKLLAIGSAVDAIQGLPDDQKPDAYKEHVQNLIKVGAIGPNDVPPEYDAGLVNSVHYQLNNNPQYATLRKNALEAQELQNKVGAYNEARDVNSSASSQARDQYGALFPELKKSMGDKWDTLSKSQVEESVKPFEFKSKLDETHANNAYKQTISKSVQDEKLDREQAKYATDLKNDLDANKGRSGNFGTISGKVQAAERLEALGDQFKNGDMPPAQMEEFALGMANMIGGSSGAARSQVEAIVPHSAVGDANKMLSWLTNDPLGAGQQKFVDMMMHTIGREKAVANKQLNQIRLQRLPAYEVYKRKYPDQYNRQLQAYGIGPNGTIDDQIDQGGQDDAGGSGLIDHAAIDAELARRAAARKKGN